MARGPCQKIILYLSVYHISTFARFFGCETLRPCCEYKLKLITDKLITHGRLVKTTIGISYSIDSEVNNRINRMRDHVDQGSELERLSRELALRDESLTEMRARNIQVC
jgi:hypothetical protein